MEDHHSHEQRQVVDLVRRFNDNEIRPRAEQIHQDDTFPRDLWDKMAGLGLMGIGIPPEYGGSGGDLMTAVLAIQAIRDCAGLALSYGAHLNLCAHNILRSGTREQKARFLPGLASGHRIGALAITEPDAGSDATAIRTKARRDGDFYVLDGTKTFITNAPVADLVVIYAKTNPEAGAMGISAFVVPAGSPGFSVSRELRKMGHHGSPTGEIILDSCRVPAENLLGRENMGIQVMMAGLDVERAFFAGAAIGLAERAMELALDYARQRSQFGRPLARFQLIQTKLADMYTGIEAARGLAYRAVREAQEAERGGKGSPIHRLAAAALCFAAQTAENVVYESLQIHGGYGYMEEYEISRLYRDVRLFTIGAGTQEIRRLLIGRELLGL